MDRDLRIRILLQKVGDLVAPLKGIGGAAKVTAGQIRETQSELRQLQRTQSDVSSFRTLKTDLAGTRDKLAETKTALTAAGKALAATETPTKALTAEFNRLKRLSEALTNQEAEQAAKLQGLRNTLAEAGISTRHLVAGEAALRDNIRATTEQLERQRKELDRVQAQEKRVAQQRQRLERAQAAASRLAVGGAASIGTGLAILAPIEGAVQAASDYQAIMTGVAQKTGLSRQEAERMGIAISTIAGKVNQLPSDLARGADTLAGLGLEASKIPPLLTPIGRAATAYAASIDDLANASFAATDNLKAPVADAAKVLDVMAEAGKRGAFELRDMAQYFPELTASAASLGQRGVPAVADLAAALQIARKGAGDAGTAANNLQNLLNKINSPETQQRFAKLGIDLPKALHRAYAQGKTPLEAIIELTNKATGGNLENLGQLFQDAQVQAALRPLIANIDLYRQIRRDALAANGTVERDFAERLNDAGQASQRLVAASEALKVKLGTALLPTLVTAAENLNAIVDRVTAWADANPALAKAIAIAAAALGAILVVVGGLAITIGGILGPFAALRFALLTIAPAAWAAMAPFLPWIAAVAGLIAIGVALYNHWSQIVAFFQGLPATFTTMGAALIDGIINGIGSRLAALYTAVTGAGAKAAAWFREKLGIRSPSRVFMSYGDMLMEGLAGGIAGNNSPVDRITRLSRDITAALAIGASVASPAGARLPGGGAGGIGGGAAPVVQQVSITIQAAPGQSARDIAEEVRKALADQARQASVARRSAYADDGE